jgi:hypothetical protein
VESEAEKMSTELGQLAQTITDEVKKNIIDISSLNPIFQELINVQSKNNNGVRYHPMYVYEI